MRLLVIVATVVAAGCLALPGVALANSDLQVTLFTDSVDPVGEEGTVTFDVTVKNNGPDTANTVEVAIAPPASLFTFLSSPVGATVDGNGKATWAVGSLANGASVSRQGTWTGAHPGADSATASVEFVGTETNAGNDDRHEPVTVTGLSAPILDLGDQVLGKAGPLGSAVITNGSSQPVTLGFVTLSGDALDVLLTFDCLAGAPIPVGGNCSPRARFQPAALGPREAFVTMSPGAGSVDPVVIDIKGRGIAAPLAAGPVGPQGPPGAVGPAGPAGPATSKLVVVPATAKLRSRAGKAVTFAYGSTLKATVTLDVLKGSKRVARVRGTARSGANKLRWNGKAGRKAASAGAYKLRLTAVNGSQKATASTKLTLVR